MMGVFNLLMFRHDATFEAPGDLSNALLRLQQAVARGRARCQAPKGSRQALVVCTGAVAALLVLLGAAGCGILHDSSSPSSANTDTFSGTLSPQGNAVRTFTLTQAGTVSVTLTSLSPAVAVGLGIGTPSGTHGCTLTTSTSVAVAGSAAQISANLGSGSFCVEIYDAGNLTTAVTYSINVTHP